MADDNKDDGRSLLPGLALLGLLLVCILGIIATCWCLLIEHPMQAGVCLIPVAIAFSAIAHVAYR